MPSPTPSGSPHRPLRGLVRGLLGTWTARLGLGVLLSIALGAVFADFLSPYAPRESDRAYPYCPPTIPSLSSDGLSVAAIEKRKGGGSRYDVDPETRHPVRWLVDGYPYRLLGLFETRVHLFGVDAPGRIHLLGTDLYGRDQFGRLLHGARISLGVAAVGVSLTVLVGLALGGLAGYLGGWTDDLIMRIAEVVLSLPGLYLILAIGATLGGRFASDTSFLIIIVALSAVSWAPLARVIRSLVLSLREREFVTAAIALGASHGRILFRHLLPGTMTFVIVQASLMVPRYIVAESVLSYLGFGIQDPDPSWGNMLASVKGSAVLSRRTWLIVPAGAIFATLLAFNVLGDVLRDELDPRTRTPGRGRRAPF